MQKQMVPAVVRPQEPPLTFAQKLIYKYNEKKNTPNKIQEINGYCGFL